MSDALDDKIYELLGAMHSLDKEEVIAQIHQAIADAGYVKLSSGKQINEWKKSHETN